MIRSTGAFREGIGTMELGNTPRDLSVEDQIPLIQNFVKYLQDENSPLMERYGNHIPTDEEPASSLCARAATTRDRVPSRA